MEGTAGPHRCWQVTPSMCFTLFGFARFMSPLWCLRDLAMSCAPTSLDSVRGKPSWRAAVRQAVQAADVLSPIRVKYASRLIYASRAGHCVALAHISLLRSDFKR